MAAMSSDLDGFTTKLNAILQADLTHAAAAAGPLEASRGCLGFQGVGLGGWQLRLWGGGLGCACFACLPARCPC